MKAFVLAAALAAASFASALDFQAAGFKPLGTVNLDGKSFDRLADPAGGEILYAADAEPSQAMLNNLAQAISVIRSWRNIRTGELRAVAESRRIRVLIVPSSIRHETTELVGFVVGGIQLFVSTGVEYDFRIKSGSYFLRLNGILRSEAELLDDITLASADPVAFLASRDPQYAVRRATELEAKLASLEASNEAGFAAQTASLAALQAQLLAFREESAAARQAEAERTAATETERSLRDQRLDVALMAALNKGKPLDNAAVAKLLELKAADASLGTGAAYLLVKAQKIPLSKRQVEIVYLVKLGELPAK